MPLLAIPFPTIDPVAIAIGPFAVRWYALAYVAGLLGGWFYARRLAQREELWGALKRPTLNDIDDLIVWVALGVVLGGRIGYVLFYNSNPISRSRSKSSLFGTAACRSMAASPARSGALVVRAVAELERTLHA